MTLFNIKKTTKPAQCEAMRCTSATAQTVPGDLWGKSHVGLCDKHIELAIQFADANPGYKPSAAPLVKESDYLAGIDIPENWAENAYTVVSAIRDSEVEAKEVVKLVAELSVQSHEELASVSDFLRDVKTKRNDIEAGDKSVTGPLTAILKRVRALMAPAKQAWMDAESLLRQKLSDAAVAEAQRNQQLVHEAAEAHAQGQSTAEHLERMTTATDLQGVSVRLVWVVVVDDLSQLPAEYILCQPDLKKLKEYAASFDGEPPAPLPGVRFVQQAPLRVTGK